MRSLGPRFALEAGFLVVVAVAAWLGRLGWVGIVLVMAGAWLAVAALEWIVSRGSARRARAAAAPHAVAPPLQGLAPVEGVTVSPPPAPAAPAPQPPPDLSEPASVVEQPPTEEARPEAEPTP